MADDKPDWRKAVDGLVRRLSTTCYGCGTPFPQGLADSADWLIRTFMMYPFALKCPDCQTPDERAEMAIRQATGPNYTVNEKGRFIEQPRQFDDDTDGEDRPNTA